jgi:hypothetical protein
VWGINFDTPFSLEDIRAKIQQEREEELKKASADQPLEPIMKAKPSQEQARDAKPQPKQKQPQPKQQPQPKGQPRQQQSTQPQQAQQTQRSKPKSQRGANGTEAESQPKGGEGQVDSIWDIPEDASNVQHQSSQPSAQGALKRKASSRDRKSAQQQSQTTVTAPPTPAWGQHEQQQRETVSIQQEQAAAAPAQPSSEPQSKMAPLHHGYGEGEFVWNVPVDSGEPKKKVDLRAIQEEERKLQLAKQKEAASVPKPSVVPTTRWASPWAVTSEPVQHLSIRFFVLPFLFFFALLT